MGATFCHVYILINSAVVGFLFSREWKNQIGRLGVCLCMGETAGCLCCMCCIFKVVLSRSPQDCIKGNELLLDLWVSKYVLFLFFSSYVGETLYILGKLSIHELPSQLFQSGAGVAASLGRSCSQKLGIDSVYCISAAQIKYEKPFSVECSVP